MSDPQFFTGPRISRGFSGQSAAQVLARFYPDVVQLRPRAVHLLIGTNDVMGVHGPSSPAMWRDSVRAMVDLARANGITVILGTLPPMKTNPFASDHRPAAIVSEQNRWLAGLAREKGLVLADYGSVLAAPDGGFKPGLGMDEIHPSPQGYAVMKPVLERALAEALGAGRD